MAKQQRFTKISTTLEEVDADLKVEGEALLKMKELVMKEICVLKAEAVTIQRLLAAHSVPSRGIERPPVSASVDPTDSSSSSSLPQINLDVGGSGSKQSKRGKCADTEGEYESEEEEMDEG